MKHKTNNHISKNDTKGQTMKGADVLVAALEKEGVDVVFAYQVVLLWNYTKH